MMDDTGLSAFASHKYLSLETFRKTGAAVRTPVWFAEENGVLFVYSTADSGKVKRIRRDGTARIAPCDMRGRVTGPWTDAQARIVEGTEASRGMILLNEKYRPWKQILDFFARWMSNRPRAVIVIGSRISATSATAFASAHT